MWKFFTVHCLNLSQLISVKPNSTQHSICWSTNFNWYLTARYLPLVVDTYRFFPHSWLITWFVTRLTRRMPLVEHTSGAGTAHPPEHLNSSPVFSAVRVTQSLVLYVCFVDHCFTLCPFGHCVVYLSLIYRFWLPLRYLQTLLADTWMFCQLLNLVAKCTCSCKNVEPDIKETFN